jgi:hypothetical protein
MVTVIPNMVGLIGLAQKCLNRPVFDIHVQVDKEALKGAHERSGLNVIECNYFLVTNFGICNLNGVPSKSVSWFFKKAVLVLLTRLSMMLWFVEERIGLFKPGRLTATYINCLSRKPEFPNRAK